MNPKGIMQAMQSAAQATGLFADVLIGEPKAAPSLDSPPTLALFSGPMVPIQSSGLSSASVRWQVNGRIYRDGFSEPAADVDPDIVNAATLFVGALAGQFTLGGLVRCIDFYGMDGEPLKAESGYLEMDRKVFRCMDLEIPLLLNDEWGLVP